MENAIEKAVRLAGSQTALANLVGVTTQAVQQWVKQGKPPSGRCRKIEAALDRQVTRYELDPEMFGDEPNEAAAPIAKNC